jgi:hypothetical protein
MQSHEGFHLHSTRYLVVILQYPETLRMVLFRVKQILLFTGFQRRCQSDVCILLELLYLPSSLMFLESTPYGSGMIWRQQNYIETATSRTLPAEKHSRSSLGAA